MGKALGLRNTPLPLRYVRQPVLFLLISLEIVPSPIWMGLTPTPGSTMGSMTHLWYIRIMMTGSRMAQELDY